MKRRKLRPGDPGFIEPILERIRTMPFEEMDAMLNYRKPGVEVTNMNAELAAWYREQAKKRDAETVQEDVAETKAA